MNACLRDPITIRVLLSGFLSTLLLFLLVLLDYTPLFSLFPSSPLLFDYLPSVYLFSAQLWNILGIIIFSFVITLVSRSNSLWSSLTCKTNGLTAFQLSLNPCSLTGQTVVMDEGDPDLSSIPWDYWQFTDIFCKQKAKTLPNYCLYDLFIQIEEGTLPLLRPIYSLFVLELWTLWDFIDKNIKIGIIRPSVTNFIWSYLHQFFDNSHSLKASLKPLRRSFDRCQSRLEAINNGQDIKQINW